MDGGFTTCDTCYRLESLEWGEKRKEGGDKTLGIPDDNKGRNTSKQI